MIYLDYAANTPTDPQVLEHFACINQQFMANPNSAHALGRAAGAEFERIKTKVATLLGVLPQEIIFTSGASESNNLAIKGIAHAYRHSGRHVLTTPLEHASAGGALTALKEQGYEVETLELNADGRVDIGALKAMLRQDTVLVSVSYVDGELGVVQPLEDMANVLLGYPNAHLHVDGAQAVGKTPLDMRFFATMTIAPHKFYGLNGCGLLIRKGDTVLEPLIHGGVSASLYRSGTPALALAASIEKALEISFAEYDARFERVKALNLTLRKALLGYPAVRINSPADAVPHILNLSVKGAKGLEFQRALDKRGVCLSVKSACSVEGTPSRAVYAVTRERKNALASFRISLSHLTSDADIAGFLDAFHHCYEELLHA